MIFVSYPITIFEAAWEWPKVGVKLQTDVKREGVDIFLDRLDS